MTPPQAAHYRLVYADPPWRFQVWNRANGLERAPDAHYDTMGAAELASVPVQDWAHKDAALILWAYDPQYPAALELGRAWGFEFVTVLFRWLKAADGQQRLFDPGERLNFGLGYHTRGGGCEEAWLFKRGKGLPVLRHDIRKEFYSTLREHSRKPDEVAQWIVDLYGDHPRLEIFARTKRLGWDVWGSETNKFNAA